MKRCERCDKVLEGRRQRRPGQRFCSPACSARRGAANNRYNGGLCFRKQQQQRWLICMRDGSSMTYARGVMMAHLKRDDLGFNDVVHHLNEDTTDDRIENLELLTRSEHMKLHHPKLTEARWGLRA